LGWKYPGYKRIFTFTNHRPIFEVPCNTNKKYMELSNPRERSSKDRMFAQGQHAANPAYCFAGIKSILNY
jgi:hypothetical protein